jgi:hypothetical protein
MRSRDPHVQYLKLRMMALSDNLRSHGEVETRITGFSLRVLSLGGGVKLRKHAVYH